MMWMSRRENVRKWWKTSYFEVHYEDPNKVEKYTEPYLSFGLRYEISDFLAQLGAEKNDFKLTRSESIAMAEIMENFRKNKGNVKKVSS